MNDNKLLPETDTQKDVEMNQAKSTDEKKTVAFAKDMPDKKDENFCCNKCFNCSKKPANE